MRYEAIMFDLDGTLLPMDMKKFEKGYFGALAARLSPIGLAPDVLIAAVWTGTKAMVKNDGVIKNAEVFWNVFGKVTGVDVAPYRAQSDDFYLNEFEGMRAFTCENPLARKAVTFARAISDKVVLATNPLFPMTAQLKRASWVGLEADDFEAVTSYETEAFSKPNPKYYLSLCERLNVAPENCLMIGNDEREDMLAASAAGMQCYLVTDNIIECDDFKWNGPRGTFDELLEFLS